MLTVLEAAELLRRFDHVLILTHVRPDGDTVGCAAALCAALRALGEQELAKHTRIENFRFTPTGTVTVGKVVAASLPGTDIQAAARITSVTLSSQKGENTVTTEIGTPILRRKP